MDESQGIDPLLRLMALGRSRQPATKPGQLILPTPPKRVKVGRNDPCPCGSGKKYKKCCLNRGRRSPKVSRRPVERPVVTGANIQEISEQTEAPAPQQATAAAMLRAGVSERIVWAYLETGLYITEANRAAQPADRLAKWEKALEAYDNAPEEDRQILAVKED